MRGVATTATSDARGAAEKVDWPSLAAGLPINGMTRELAAASELISADGGAFRLRVPVKSLAEPGTVERLRVALTAALGRPVRLNIEFGETADTATARADRARNEKQKRAEQSIYNDPFVQQLIENFGAAIDPSSIKPAD